MANLIYPKGKQHFLTGDINLSSDTIKVSLIDSTFYQYAAGDETTLNIPVAAIVATQTLSGKTITNGIFDANDATFPSLTGSQSEALVIYKDTGVGSTSYLIAYIDQATVLPITPDGSDVVVQWSNSSSKIFSL